MHFNNSGIIGWIIKMLEFLWLYARAKKTG